MKKTITLIAVIAVLLLMCIGCSLEPDNTMPALPESAGEVYNGLAISVDARMELLSIVQYIGDNHNVAFGLMSQYFTDYKYDIDTHFRDYEKHPAVMFHDEITAENFPVDEPPTIILFMNDDFSLNKEAFREYLQTKEIEDLNFNSEEVMEQFFDLLKTFASDSGFYAFYNNHRGYYNQIISETKEKLPEENLLGYMEEFYGREMNSYNLILTTLFHTGGFGPSITKDNQTDIYAIFGPDRVVDRIPDFRSQEELMELEAHEFGHSFINVSNEIQSPFAGLIDASAYLQDAIKEDMSLQGYGNWDTVLEETILRACVIKQLSHFNPNTVPKLLQQERDTGFLYIDTVYDLLDSYLAQRDEFPEFNMFIPNIINELTNQYAETPKP